MILVGETDYTLPTTKGLPIFGSVMVILVDRIEGMKDGGRREEEEDGRRVGKEIRYSVEGGVKTSVFILSVNLFQ